MGQAGVMHRRKHHRAISFGSGNEPVTSSHQHRLTSHQAKSPEATIWRENLSFCVWVPYNIINEKRVGLSGGNLRNLDYLGVFCVTWVFKELEPFFIHHVLRILGTDFAFLRKYIFIRTWYLGAQIMYFKHEMLWLKKNGFQIDLIILYW